MQIRLQLNTSSLGEMVNSATKIEGCNLKEGGEGRRQDLGWGAWELQHVELEVDGEWDCTGGRRLLCPLLPSSAKWACS